MANKPTKVNQDVKQAKVWRQVTTITFSAQDLLALTRLVAGGQVLLGTTHPVVSRLKTLSVFVR